LSDHVTLRAVDWDPSPTLRSLKGKLLRRGDGTYDLSVGGVTGIVSDANGILTKLEYRLKVEEVDDKQIQVEVVAAPQLYKNIEFKGFPSP
jgi:hypothetical protein